MDEILNSLPASEIGFKPSTWILLALAAILAWRNREEIFSFLPKPKPSTEIVPPLSDENLTQDVLDFQAVNRIHARGVRTGNKDLVALANKCLACFHTEETQQATTLDAKQQAKQAVAKDNEQ